MNLHGRWHTSVSRKRFYRIPNIRMKTTFLVKGVPMGSGVARQKWRAKDIAARSTLRLIGYDVWKGGDRKKMSRLHVRKVAILPNDTEIFSFAVRNWTVEEYGSPASNLGPVCPTTCGCVLFWPVPSEPSQQCVLGYTIDKLTICHNNHCTSASGQHNVDSVDRR